MELDTLRPKDADIHFRLPVGAERSLRAQAKARGIRLSALVRWLVLEGLRDLEEAS
ncbi:MAG TPA: hypothetical protein VGY32_11525 [Solirubrobacteraceae bacterium]|nr:hypothetical protein [Solirubrobacteraceae bacterium]